MRPLQEQQRLIASPNLESSKRMHRNLWVLVKVLTAGEGTDNLDFLDDLSALKVIH